MRHGVSSHFIGIVVALCLACTSSAMAADTFTDSIKNGTISGEAKIWYQTNDSDADERIFHKENSWFDAGLALGYVTDVYKGFSAGVRFYAVDDLSAYGNWANRSMMGVDHKDTESWLGEAYISYLCHNTTPKLGRQNISSPLVNSDRWALFPNNFEAIMVTNTDVSDTKLIGGYIWEERWVKSQDFDEFHDGVAMLGVVNKSLKDTELAGYFYHADKDEWELTFERGVTTFPLPQQKVYLTPRTELGFVYGEGTCPSPILCTSFYVRINSLSVRCNCC